jgi:uncharacterized protein YndB with AHSA1/START domain
MLPVRVHTFISASREDVFDFVADMASRPSWTDHYMKDFRLENPRAQGVGAAARYRIEPPLYKQWVETEIVEADRARRIVEATRSGRLGGGRGEVILELEPQGRRLTRVDMTILMEAGTLREHVQEKLGARRWLRRRSKKALVRLRAILEAPGTEPLPRATVAGWEPGRAPRFGISVREARG